MAFYAVLFQKTFLRNFQYRLASLINNLGSLIFGFMYIAIWQGTLGPDQLVLGLNRQEMGQYLAFTQSMLFITTFLPRGWNIGEGVRTGSISLDLMRPPNFFIYHLVQSLGVQAYNCCLRSIPIYLILAMAVGFPAQSWTNIVLLLFSLLLSAYLGFLLNYFVGISAFWTNSNRWAFILQQTLILTLSGNFVPSPLMPGILGLISTYSPFAGLHFYPTMIYLGKLSWQALWVPLGWGLILTIAALVATRKARRKMEVQGG